MEQVEALRNNRLELGFNFICLGVQNMKHLEDLLKETEKIAEIEKCRTCQCLYDALCEFKEVLRDQEGAGDIRERLAMVLAKAMVTHGCLGCDPCLPAPVSNELADMGGGSLSRHCQPCPQLISLPELPPTMNEESPWPVEKGEYLIGEKESPMAITTLGSDDLPERLARELGSQGFAIVGKTHTENIGIEKIIKNTVANPHIRFLILCGKDAQGHFPGQSLLSLGRNGVAQDRKIQGAQGRRPVLKNVDFSAIEHFRSQIDIVDLIGLEDIREIKARVDTCIRKNPGRFEKEIAIKKAPQVEAHLPERLVLDPSGFFIIYPKKEEQRIYLEHYGKDGTLTEIIYGETPAVIASTAIERGLVSRLDHAAYLGWELEKALLSMLYGFPYIQDRAPGGGEEE